MNLALFLNTLAFILANDDDIGGAFVAPAILAASGFIFYGIMYSRYRNADKRHIHEKETSSVVAHLGCADTLIKSRKGLKNASMTGANHTRVEGALNTGRSKKLFEK